MSFTMSPRSASVYGSPTRSVSGSADPVRTLAAEMAREEEARLASSGRTFRSSPARSPPRNRSSSATHVNSALYEYRSEFTQPAGGQQGAAFQNAELRALSESMRSLSGPMGGFDARPSPLSQQLQLSPSPLGDDFCPVCEQEEQSMSATQQRRHLEHKASGSHHHHHHHHTHPPPQSQQHESRAYEQPRSALHDSFAIPASSSFHNASSASFAPLPSPATDESLLYSSQPSRAVLSALRSLQDKLQELRVEKAATENRAVQAEQVAAEREYELSKQNERVLAEVQAKSADLEAVHLARLKESRESEERQASANLKLENEVRMLRENLATRDADVRALREDALRLKAKINDAELDLARAANERSSGERVAETERAIGAERELEVQRLKNEVNTLAEQLHQARAQHQAVRTQLAGVEEARNQSEGATEAAQASVSHLAADLQVASRELSSERATVQSLLRYKYTTRDYVASLLNLNYELCIDAGMSVRKRNELLKHSQDLLQGLKKQAWAIEDEAALAGDGTPSSPFGSGSPPRNMTIGGVSTSIEEQRYLLAAASSPEAIRVLHPETREPSSESDNEDEREAGGEYEVRVRVPNTPTVASTLKKHPTRSKPSVAPTKGAAHCHALTSREISLPFTVGRSAKQSFSVPVNVQEILAKQPAYFNKISQKQQAQTRKRAQGGLPGPVEEERILVFPPPPASSLSGGQGASESASGSPPPVSLAAHAVGLSTVIAHLESEVAQLNRDYIYHLENSRRDGDADKHQLQQRLQGILAKIESKSKQVELLKQHQEAVVGNHGVRLYSASTTASRNGRSGPSATSVSHKKPTTGTASSHRASVRPATTATSALRATSVKRRVSMTASVARPATASSTSTDLADRHAHHQHGAQASPPRARARYVDDALYGGDEPPSFGYGSPSSQRLLQKKIASMRLLSQFKDLDGGEALKRFGE